MVLTIVVVRNTPEPPLPCTQLEHGGGLLTVIRPESIELTVPDTALSVTKTFAFRVLPASPEGRTYAKLFEVVSIFATIMFVSEL